MLLFVGGTWLIIKRITHTKEITRYFNIVALILLLLPIVTIVLFTIRSRSDWDANTRMIGFENVSDQVNENFPRPDIYYIILDAYSRSDYMQTDFGFDNTYFIDFLREHQFYIAEQSNSNYNWTSLSLGSSLNMDFVQNLGLDLVFGNYPAIFVDPIRHSRVRTQLEQLGYQTIAFRTSYIPTEIIDADIYYASDPEILENLREPLSLNSFESMLLRSTAGLILWDVAGPKIRNWVEERISYPANVLRQTILDQFEYLGEVPSIPDPKFIFTHIVAPHPPFLFGPNGEYLNQEDVFTLADTNGLSGTRKAELYKDQATYITSRVMETVETILQNSDTPPIIILQADHGPCINVMSCSEGDGLRQKFAILNAYYLPGGCDQSLYPTITPVNSFRIIFNCYYDADYPLLEDNSFHTNHPSWSAYQFKLVNEEIR